MVQKNFAHEVGRLAGVDLSAQTGGASTVAGAMAHADKATKNLANLADIKAMAIEVCQKPASPESSAPSSALKGTLTEAMVIGAATLASPVTGAFVGAAYAAKGIGQFLQHAGTQAATLSMVKNNGGSMNLTHDAATFSKDGEMTGYIAACDGIMTDVATGQTVQPPQTQLPTTKLGSSVQEALDEYGAERASRDVARLMENIMGNYYSAAKQVSNLTNGNMRIDGPNPEGDDFDLGAHAAARKPSPLGLNVGMKGAPVPSVSAPSFG